MNCRKCGKPLPSDGVVCKFCGMPLSATDLEERKSFQNNKNFQADLMSDHYGVDKTILFNDKNKNDNNENKLLGLAIIGGILLFLIILVIIINAT